MSKVSDKQISYMRELQEHQENLTKKANPQLLLDYISKFMFEMNKALKDFEDDLMLFVDKEEINKSNQKNTSSKTREEQREEEQYFTDRYYLDAAENAVSGELRPNPKNTESINRITEVKKWD